MGKKVRSIVRVIHALNDPRFSSRTTEGLAKATGLRIAEVVEVIEDTSGVILSRDGRSGTLYSLSETDTAGD